MRCFWSPSLAEPPIIATNVGAPQRSTSHANPAVTLPAADKILRHLLRRFPFRDLNSVSVSNFVIDEHVRTGTLNS